MCSQSTAELDCAAKVAHMCVQNMCMYEYIKRMGN